MIKLKAFTYQVSTKINDLPVTHRLFIAFMFVAVMYGLNMLTGIVMSFNTLEKVQLDEQTYLKNSVQFNADLEKLEALVNQPEKELLEIKINKLKEKINKVDDDIELITRLLIDPKTMTQLLDNIIKKQDKLKLRSLKSIDHIKKEDLGLYQHQVEITVQGSFIEVSKYLHDLEAMPFKVYWKSIDYRSLDTRGNTPSAEVILKIYTLSREGGWLGV